VTLAVIAGAPAAVLAQGHPDEVGLSARQITIEAGGRQIVCFRARPEAVSQPKPGMVVFGDPRGGADAQDAARDLARRGFLVLAPVLDPKTAAADVRVTVAHLSQDPDCSGRIGVLALCGADELAWRVLAGDPVVAAAVVYGQEPPANPQPPLPGALLVQPTAQCAGRATADDDTWRKTVAFLEEQLGGSPNPG
jgi:dienelactone hydrolase